MFNHVIKLSVLLALSFAVIRTDAKDKPRVETRIGYLTDQPMQHPKVSDRDDYLDIYDKKGEVTKTDHLERCKIFSWPVLTNAGIIEFVDSKRGEVMDAMVLTKDEVLRLMRI